MTKKRTAKGDRLRLHKGTGTGYLLLDGRRIYVGSYAAPATREKADRLLAEYLAAGRRLPVPQDELTVAELVARFIDHAAVYYRHLDGTPTGEAASFRYALRPLVALYGRTEAARFGPLAFRAVRDALVAGKVEGMRRPPSRSYTNACMRRIRRLFRWGVGLAIVPPAVLHGLQAVDPLRYGRSTARETVPVRAVEEAHVEAVLPHLPRVVAAMVRVQLLTAMRPGEVCLLRPCDVDRSGPVWAYRPPVHKGAHHGRTREVLIGPRGQEILRPFLLRSAEACCFSPAETVEEVRAERHEGRVTPEGQGNEIGTNRKARPEVTPGRRYDVRTYGRCIRRACKVAKVPAWAPNMLRHRAATKLRAAAGLDVAAAVLGHAHGSTITAAVYAAADVERARRVVAEVG